MAPELFRWYPAKLGGVNHEQVKIVHIQTKEESMISSENLDTQEDKMHMVGDML